MKGIWYATPAECCRCGSGERDRLCEDCNVVVDKLIRRWGQDCKNAVLDTSDDDIASEIGITTSMFVKRLERLRKSGAIVWKKREDGWDLRKAP